MQNLTFRYTRHYNSKHNRSGSLFKGRYSAVLIDADNYLSDLVRYVHNCPVITGASKSAKAAKWTSHAAYLGDTVTPDWLTTSQVLNEFGSTLKVARKRFTAYVDQGVKDGERPDLINGIQGGRILGDERFAKKALKPPKVQPKPVTLNQLVKRVCREVGVKEAELTTDSRARVQSELRQTITYLALEFDVASLTDMANRFNRDLTTMSRNQRFYRDKLAENKQLQKQVRSLKRQVLVA